MKKNRSTKRALLMSVLSMVLCLSMLVGSTFAWFTDSVTSKGNIIKSGTLDVELLDASGASLEGKVIEWDAADDRDQEAILWEPGCTYKTEPFTVKNAGNLALKYEIVINGIDGNAKLLEAIEWTVTVGDDTIALANLKGELPAGESTAKIVLSGHMKEEAGNEYQGLTAEGISIAVFATQLTAEEDSFGKDYDANATLPEVTVVSTAADLAEALAAGGDIVLTADIAMGGTQITIPAGVTATLDLNGCDLNGNFAGTDHYAMFTIENGASLTVKGEGDVSANTKALESNRSLAIFHNRGNLTIENGNYTLKDSSEGKTWIIATIVDNRTNSASCNTLLTINGGEFSVVGNAKNLFRNYPQQGGTATLTINNGVFHADGKETYIWNQESSNYLGQLNFKGGTYDTDVVYEDYNGQSDIYIAEGVVIKPYSGNN